MTQKCDVSKHVLVPKHSLVSEAEKNRVTASLNLSGQQLPRILKTDPAIIDLKPKEGDIVKIVRNSATAGKAIFYRRVINA